MSKFEYEVPRGWSLKDWDGNLITDVRTQSYVKICSAGGVVNTLDAPHSNYPRSRSGNTTRQVHWAMMMALKGYAVEVLDHSLFEDQTVELAGRILMHVEFVCNVVNEYVEMSVMDEPNALKPVTPLVSLVDPGLEKPMTRLSFNTEALPLNYVNSLFEFFNNRAAVHDAWLKESIHKLMGSKAKQGEFDFSY